VAVSNKKSGFNSPAESNEFLLQKMKSAGISTLEDLAQLTGLDRGTLSRYFHQERRPSIDVIAPICEALNVSPETLLIGLGALPKKK
jgi:transcriptional regulator with XRE-family HTH domain